MICFRTHRILVLGLFGLPLCACTTFGTNVSGSFQCNTQEARCAPTQVIDDDALALIAASEEQAQMVPAGPIQVDDGLSPFPNAGVIARSQGEQYQLRVRFPATSGVYGHEGDELPRYVAVSLPGRSQLLDEVSRRSRPRGPGGLLSAAENAPPLFAPVPQQAAAVEPRNPIERIEEQVSSILNAPPITVSAPGVFPNGGE